MPAVLHPRRRQPTRKAADDASRFAAHQLERIGILLLGHEAAAGCCRISEIEKAEFLRCKEDQVFANATEMNHRQRSSLQEAGDEVAFSRGSDGVGDDAGETEASSECVDVDGIAGARDCAGAERQRIRFGSGSG